MPTVLRIGGLRVVIYPNDHPPPHVHVIGAQEQAVFQIGGEEATLRESYRFTTGGAPDRGCARASAGLAAGRMGASACELMMKRWPQPRPG